MHIIIDFPIAEHLKCVIKSKLSDFMFMLQVIHFLLSNCELNTVKQHFEMYLCNCEMNNVRLQHYEISP